MSNTIIELKHSQVSGNSPSSLANGEISINTYDGKLFYKNPSGTIQPFDKYPGPSGLNGEIQFNDSGTLGADVGLSYNKTTKTLTSNNLVGTTNVSGQILYTSSYVQWPDGTKQYTANAAPGSAAVTSVAGVTGIVSNTNLLDGIITVDGSGSGLDADLLDGLEGSSYGNSIFTQSSYDQANTGTTHANAAFAHANSGYNQANTGTIHANAAFAHANSAYDKANSGYTQANTGTTHADAAFAHANSGYIQANTATTHASSAYDKANTGTTHADAAFAHANSGYTQANTATAHASAAYDTANTGVSHAVSAYTQANTGTTHASAAFTHANSAYGHANSAYDKANSGYTQANTGTTHAVSAYNQANTGTTHAASAYNQANTGTTHASSAYDKANSAYNHANTKFASAGGTISGDVTVTGNLTISGTTTTVSANNLAIQDNMIYLNDGSVSTNPDLGFVGNYNDGTYKHAGFFRDQSDGYWKPFDGYLPEPDASIYIDTSNASFSLAGIWVSQLKANNVTANQSSLGTVTSGTWNGSSISTTYTDAKTVSVGGQTGAISNTQILNFVSAVDGAGSGLDADLLDGRQASTFVYSDGTDNGAVSITVNDADFVVRDTTDGTTNYIWRDYSANVLYLGAAASAVITPRSSVIPFTDNIYDLGSASKRWSNVYVNNITITNDGSGSGLDADLLDGIDSASFLRSDADDSFTGTITNNGVFEALLDSGTPTTSPRLKFGRSASQFMTFHGNSSGNYMTAVSSSGNPKPTMYFGVSTDGGATLSGSYTLSGTSGSIWHTGNDGAGSGLDADLWDGNQFASYLNQAVLTSSSPTFAAATISGNLTVDTDTLFVNSTSNLVGIGTVSPSAKLDVNGKIVAAETIVALGGGTYVNGDSQTDVAIAIPTGKYLKSKHGNSNIRTLIGHDGTGVQIGQSGTSLIGYTKILAGSAGYISLIPGAGEAVRIESGGNVGIGTTTPADKLHVYGGKHAYTTASQTSTVRNAGIRFWSDNAFGAELHYGQTGHSSGWATALYGRTTDTTALRLGAYPGSQTAQNTFIEYMTVLNSGNVGIGTTTPSYKLHVNGSFAATTKSFVIDHPTKPGMKLRYGSLEGPENGVYVRGKLKGTNVIELPEYWTKLVDPDSITVQLTSIGKHQKLYVEDIKDNKIFVSNEESLSEEINCFYLVHAERADVDKLEVEL